MMTILKRKIFDRGWKIVVLCYIVRDEILMMKFWMTSHSVTAYTTYKPTNRNAPGRCGRIKCQQMAAPLEGCNISIPIRPLFQS